MAPLAPVEAASPVEPTISPTSPPIGTRGAFAIKRLLPSHHPFGMIPTTPAADRLCRPHGSVAVAPFLLARQLLR